jgi:AcrR family transcriptional regulator
VLKAVSFPTKVPRKRMPRAEREQQMIEVALNLFVSAGYQGTSIEDIAAAAGVSRPILYKLFGSKDKIYLACLERARECLNNCLIEAVGSASSFQDRLRAGIDGYFQFVEQNRAAWRLLFAGGAAVAGSAAEEARHLRFDTVGKIADLLSPFMSGIEKSALEINAHALSGAAEQVAKWWLENDQTSRETVVDLLTSLLWAGFGSTDTKGAANQGRPKKSASASARPPR